MEDKQLNINQPLLSVRRFSSIVASQKNENRKNKSCLPSRPSFESCKTELKSDLMRNPASVPFVWEHSPGRPKDETNKQIQTKESPPSLPKLPPGRMLKPKKKDLDNITEETNVTKTPMMDHSSPHSVLPTEEKITKFESAKSTKKESSDSGDNDDNDEAYMDALDTLSRGESSFYNCSASGVSGLESDLNPTGILSADPKIRDFMMGRFLPAAKAMASEVPQQTSRKHVVKEKPREVKKLVNMGSKKLQLRYGPTFLQDFAHDNEEEDSDYDYDEHGNISPKLCGLLPRFCLKGSFGLVNPVSGLSMRTRLPMSPANRTHASSSSISSFSETENEPARVAIYEHRSFGGSHLAKHQEDKSVLQSEFIETTSQNNSPKLEGLGLYNRLQGRGISASPSESSQSSVSERNESSSQKKGLTSFKELLADKNKNETASQGSMVEKTLYVDTVHIMKSPKAESLPSSITEQSNFRAHYTDTPKILHSSCESLETDMLADESKHDMKMETHTGCWKDPEVDVEVLDNMNGDQNLNASRGRVLELPAPPPLPKSPSDSWLWRTLPSMSSRHTPIPWNPKYPSSNTFSTDPKSDRNIELRYSQGPLLPIPET